MEYHKVQLQLTSKEQDIIRLQQELQQCRAALSGACLAASGQGAELPLPGAGPLFGSQPPGILGRRLVLESLLELCKEGSCRVMSYSEYLTLLVVSYAGTNSHLTGTGIKKINVLISSFFVCSAVTALLAWYLGKLDCSRLLSSQLQLTQLMKKVSKLNFAPRLETCPVPAQYQIFTVETSKMEGMNNNKLFWW